MPRRAKGRRRLFRELPPIGIRARIAGTVEYLCPYCYRFYRRSGKPLRHRCRATGCRKSVCFGLYAHMGGPLQAQEPYVALFGDQQTLYHCNRLTLQKTDFCIPAIGRITGAVDFQCPTCHLWTRDTPAWATGKVRCRKCLAPLWFTLILWSVPTGVKRFLPHDWIPPAPSERLAPQEPRQELGPDSDGAGDFGPAPLWS